MPLHHSDMRKGLKLLIEADSEWQLNLRQLKEQSPPDELPQYSIRAGQRIDTVADSGKNARENAGGTEQTRGGKEA